MEMGRIPEAIAGYDYVLRIHPLDAGSFINRRESLKSCTYKGQCTFYSFEEGQMIPQIGYIYTYEGTCFITLAMDDKKHFYINKSHVCGGIVHFQCRKRIILKSPNDFFNNFESDTYNIPWAPVNIKLKKQK